MRKLTEGNITKQILLFMLPVLLGNSLQRFYTLADTIMVGQLLGTDSLAAVGASSSIAMLFTVICNGFTSGFSIVIGQYFGANDSVNEKRAVAGTYILSVLLGIVLTTVGAILVRPLLIWTNIPPALFDEAASYLRILLLGLVATLVYNMMANILRAFGDSTVPLIFLFVSVSFNILLDYLFIAVFKTGVKGAAAATIISQVLSAVGCIVFCVLRRPRLGVTVKDLRSASSVFKTLIPQGLAMCLMLSVVSVGTVILQSGINSLGNSLIAGYTAARKYLEFMMMPGAALSTAAAAYVSQNYGARLFDRIKSGVRQMILMGFIWSTVASVIVFVLGRYMVISVTGSDVDLSIINAGVLYLRSNVILFYFLIILVIIRSALQGMNHKKTPVIASCIELAVKTLAVVLFVPKLGFLGICITEPVIWILGAIWVFVSYRQVLKKAVNNSQSIA